MHVVVVCGQGQGQAVVFPIYAIQGLEKRCAFSGTKITCITMCSDVCSSLAPTYIAGGEDIITMCSDMCYQSLSVLAERPGNQVGPHGASVMNPSSFGE